MELRGRASGPTPFAYRMRFMQAGGATMMHVDVSASLGRAADLAAPIARSVVRRGVDANLATLKRLLEDCARGSSPE